MTIIIFLIIFYRTKYIIITLQHSIIRNERNKRNKAIGMQRLKCQGKVRTIIIMIIITTTTNM